MSAQEVAAGHAAFQQLEGALKTKFHEIECAVKVSAADAQTVDGLARDIRNLAKCFFCDRLEQDLYKANCHQLGKDIAGIISDQMVIHFTERAEAATTEAARLFFEREAEEWPLADANTGLGHIDQLLGFKELGGHGPFRALLKI